MSENVSRYIPVRSSQESSVTQSGRFHQFLVFCLDFTRLLTSPWQEVNCITLAKSLIESTFLIPLRCNFAHDCWAFPQNSCQCLKSDIDKLWPKKSSENLAFRLLAVRRNWEVCLKLCLLPGNLSHFALLQNWRVIEKLGSPQAGEGALNSYRLSAAGWWPSGYYQIKRKETEMFAEN